MILKIAQAMFRQDHDEPWEQAECLTKEIYLNNARTALEIVREPTSEMKEAFVETFYGWNVKCEKRFVDAAWQAAIDKALEHDDG